MSEAAVLARLCMGSASVAALADATAATEATIVDTLARLRAAGIEFTDVGDLVALSAPVELLDRDRILASLDDAARAQLQSLALVFDTGSTQADALAAPVPPQGCALFLAERQSAGQGRLGRAWTSPLAANLYLSLSRRFARPLSAMSGLSLVVGVAVAEALRGSGFDAVGVKWPNDLVASGGKLGGILVQLRADGPERCSAVVGLGLNVRMPASFAADIDQAWCDLAGLGGVELSRNRIAAAVLDTLLPALALFERDGLAPFLPRWQVLDALAGKPVRVLDGPRVHEGVALGIAASGGLRLAQGADEQVFASGEASVRTA